MSCRCGDIGNLERDKSKLQGALGMLPTYRAKKGAASEQLGVAAVKIESITKSEKVAAYHGTITSLADSMDQCANAMTGKINSKISDIDRTLSALRSEDHDYHEEERRRAEEEAARAAAEAAARAFVLRTR